jgi:hypothetical protein
MKKIIYLENTRKNKSLMYKSWNSKMSTEYIILSLVPMPIHQITAVLDVPNGYLQKGEKSGEIIAACTDNPWVTVDPAFLATCAEDLKAYNNSVGSARDSAWKVLHKDLKKLMRLFQEAADSKPADAITIVESAKFRVKKVHIHQIQKFEASNGIDSGVIDLIAQGGGTYTCHDWWYSSDGVVFVRMQPTVAAKTQMRGLKPLTLAYFMHELIGKKGGEGMSEIIKIQVK